jgi:hypothetical protein
MAGDVKLKINGDASGLLAAVKTAMAQIEQEAKKLKLSPGMGGYAGGAPGVAPGVKEYQQAHTKVQQIRNDQIAAEVSRNSLIQKEALLVKIARQESEIAKSGKDASFWANKRLETERAINNEKKAGAILDKTSGGGGGGWRPGISSVASIIGAAGLGANYIGQRPIDIAQMQGSAISMMVGRQLREARSGEYTYQSMYGNDRQRATEQAATSNKWKTGGDILEAVASAALVLGAGASVITTGGLSLPALALGGAGLAGLKSGLLDKGLGDPSKYSAFQAQRQAQDFTTLLAASQESSPYRKDAIDRFQATAARDIGMQRTLGLNDFDWKTRRGAGMGGYYGAGGYLKSQMGLGFTDEMVTGASQGILGAGGSSAMARQSGISLQAERGLGLTNANQLLGQLSGTQSIPSTAKSSLIEIFARGFDSSRYAEENRKYMQAVTEQVFKGGATGTDAVDSIADLIKASIGNAAPTTRNIEAGKTAFEAYKASTSSLSGYMGGINMTSAMKDPDLKNIKDPAELAGLIGMPIDAISEDDAAIIDSASRMQNMSPKALAEKLRKLKSGNANTALNRGKNAPVAARRYMAKMTAGISDVQAQQGYLNMIDGGGESPYGATMTGDQAAAAMANTTTGKAGDTAIQASAQNAQVSLDTLAVSINKFADDAMKAAQKLGAEAPTGRAKEAQDAADLVTQSNPLLNPSNPRSRTLNLQHKGQ